MFIKNKNRNKKTLYFMGNFKGIKEGKKGKEKAEVEGKLSKGMCSGENFLMTKNYFCASPTMANANVKVYAKNKSF